MEAASSVECPPLTQDNEFDYSRCTLLDTWLSSDSPSGSVHNSSHSISVDGSPFQSILGISSLEVAMKNDYHGDAYPFIKTHHDTWSHVEAFLDLDQATAMGKFMIVLILKLVMSPKLPLSAPNYGQDIEAGIQSFMNKYADNLDKHGIRVCNLDNT